MISLRRGKRQRILVAVEVETGRDSVRDGARRWQRRGVRKRELRRAKKRRTAAPCEEENCSIVKEEKESRANKRGAGEKRRKSGMGKKCGEQRRRGGMRKKCGVRKKCGEKMRIDLSICVSLWIAISSIAPIGLMSGSGVMIAAIFSMEKAVEEARHAYDDFMAAMTAVAEAKAVAGVERTTATEAALEAFGDRYRSFLCALDASEAMVCASR
ncbi:hypothetical protein ZIOFF_030654 [Zingiber officinale]|uniref:Uncharacterized protein n=1 Tax=Zingiber officinale TaxID=94328 RepID=A0A8J5LI13_ZINOF|nr:hypothetical protein ZIOFF_030654 [Zingiber officinale]